MGFLINLIATVAEWLLLRGAKFIPEWIKAYKKAELEKKEVNEEQFKLEGAKTDADFTAAQKLLSDNIKSDPK